MTAAGGLFVLLLVAIFLWAGGDDPPTGNGQATVASRAKEAVDAVDQTPSENAGREHPSLEPKTVTEEDLAKPPIAEEPKPSTQPSDALFIVVVGEDVSEEEANGVGGAPVATRFYRIGTAWALDAHTLVTSAAVVMAMEDLRERFTHAEAFWPARNKRIPVVGTNVHPQYATVAEAFDKTEEALRELEEERRELEELLTQPERAKPAAIDVQRIRERWSEAVAKQFEAMERQSFFDVGTIRLAEPVDAFLTLAPVERPEALRPKLPVHVLGFPVDLEDRFIDPDAPPPTSWKLVGRIARLDEVADQPAPLRRLLIDLNPPRSDHPLDRQLDFIYAGSPVLNERDQVIGVYSRPSPPPAPNQQPDGSSCDVVLVNLVRELVADGD